MAGVTLIEPPEIIEVAEDTETVACDGGALFGHPNVYLTIGDDGHVDCYYCGRRFVHATKSEQASSQT